MQRAKSITEIEATEFEHFDFEGDWLNAFDKPERCGTWFIWGKSGNGKTSFTYQFAKYLAKFEKVLVNDYEEGDRSSQKELIKRINFTEVKGRIKFVKEPMTDLIERLLKAKSKAPKIVLINSWQYANMTFLAFRKMTEQFPKTLFIVISQTKANNVPLGESAERVMSHADLKIWVEGHRAISKGRYIGKKGYMNNWLEGAIKYWGAA